MGVAARPFAVPVVAPSRSEPDGWASALCSRRCSAIDHEAGEVEGTEFRTGLPCGKLGELPLTPFMPEETNKSGGVGGKECTDDEWEDEG